MIQHEREGAIATKGPTGVAVTLQLGWRVQWTHDQNVFRGAIVGFERGMVRVRNDLGHPATLMHPRDLTIVPSERLPPGSQDVESILADAKQLIKVAQVMADERAAEQAEKTRQENEVRRLEDSTALRVGTNRRRRASDARW